MTPQQEQRRWKREIDLADKREKSWRDNGKKIYDRYRGKEKRRNTFNILWANTEVLRPALFNSAPKPDVRRRFRDADPVGKTVGEVMERALTYSVDVYDLPGCVKYDVLDALLPGRGLSRIRYVPSFAQVGTTPEQHAKTDAEGEKSHEAHEGNTEELEYEQVVCEHVDWEHFRHGYGKTWGEVQWCAFYCQLNKTDAEEKFGKDIAAAITYDEVKEEGDRKADQDATDDDKVADFWEIWDKAGKKVFFLQKSYTAGLIYPLDNPDGEPPLKLQTFFPIPEPLKVVEDSSSLLPVALWDLYKEQADELDRLSARINKVINALKVRGVYDATLSEMSGLMSGEDNDLFPLANAAAIRSAGGLDKAIWWMPVEQSAKVLISLYDARDRCKQVIFEITGLSDIVRGQSNPNETLGAQKIKANYSSLRLQRMQREVQRYVRDLIRLMGEVIGDRFQPATLQQMTGLQLPDAMKKQQLAMQAQQAGQAGQPVPDELQAMLKVPTWDDVMQVLRSDMLRQFRVDVETDSTVQESLDADMEGLQQVMTGLTGLWQASGPAVQAGAIKIDAIKQISLAIVRRARMGMAVEDAIDTGMQEPKPPPQQEQPQDNSLQVEAQKQEAENQRTQLTLQAEAQRSAEERASNERIKMEEIASRERIEAAKLQAESERRALDEQAAARAHELEYERIGLDRERMSQDGQTTAEKLKIERANKSKDLQDQEAEEEGQKMDIGKMIAESMDKLHARIDQVEKKASAKRVLIRDKSGRPIASQIEGA